MENKHILPTKSRTTTYSFHKIIHPEGINNLQDCCEGRDGKIVKCYGLGKSYCPSSCYYATMKNLANLIQGVIRTKE